ncbi:uncharacterized protein ARMOST_15186 [Armillaria ostoyae]|uniref:AC transposase n=1 Tax=Armillaria ostoyae TaxID=47428 RepID=A0A284RSN7_ARMOS|nr:uncharacterized protein ARMOST_15186 [Armillaria ostoyae]
MAYQRNTKRQRASGTPPAKKTKRTNANVPDEGLTVTTGEVLSGTSVSTSKPTTGKHKKQNPIYLFYESVDVDANGSSGSPGDRHYKCYHGNRKVLTITKAMWSSLNGLIGHLKHFPVMYRLYEVLHQRPEPPTSEEEDIASGKCVLEKDASREYLSQLEKASKNIVKALEKQAAKAVGDWDQAKFERLLLEWIVACDQPFEEVERPEFHELLEYTHHTGKRLHIPGRTTVQRRVKEMGIKYEEDLRNMFAEMQGKVSISLDCWTSPNGYAFMAIIAHYITNKGKLEELLIDFHELIGEHSGENMATVVWETLKMYRLTDRIMAFVMDNATNNDTMVAHLEYLCAEAGISFSAKNS